MLFDDKRNEHIYQNKTTNVDVEDKKQCITNGKLFALDSHRTLPLHPFQIK